MSENPSSTSSAEAGPDETTEGPELRLSRQQERDHKPDKITVGYDPTGDTRVGMGQAEGRLERLVRLNEGRHQADGRHSSREAARDKKRIAQAFCPALDVTPYQQREVVSVMGRLNLNRFGRQKRLEKVALGVIRLVVDRDRERLFFGGHDPTQLDLGSVDLSRYPASLTDDSRYQALCKQHDLSAKDRYSISQLLKRELKRIGYFERTSVTHQRE